MMSIRQEDIAAENILKRAELNRITRQLKSRLSKTNLKTKLKEKKSLTNLSQNGSIISKPSSNSKRLSKQKSLESLIDANKTEDESSPIRNQLPPSSPLYEEFQIPIIPKTPPQQKITLNTDIYNSSSTNKTQLHLSSPAKPQQGSGTGVGSAMSNHLSTPKRGNNNHQDEGADLLMFLATSPSPIQYKNYPSTPSRALQPSSNTNSNQKLQVPKDQGSAHKFATPATPKRSLNLNNLMKTPGFNMNDYVNLFSPSPRVSRTPASQSQISSQLQSSAGQQQQQQQQHGSGLSFQQNTSDNQKDVNGKLIKF